MYRIESSVVAGAFAVLLLSTCIAAGIAVQQRGEIQALRTLKACPSAVAPAPIVKPSGRVRA